MSEIIKQIEQFLNNNELVLAKKLLDQLLDINPNVDLYTHYLIGLYHIKKKDYDLAIPHLLNIIQSEQSPYFLPKCYKILAYTYLKQEKFWDARAILDKIREDFYTDLDIKNMFAYTLFSLKQMDESLTLYEQILTEDPTNITALNGLAMIECDIQDNPQKAINLLEPYLNTDPRVLDTLGWSYFKLGDLHKAQELLQQAFEQIPNHPDITKHLTIVMSHL